jgi:capsular polysaccharide transport system permease protein
MSYDNDKTEPRRFLPPLERARMVSEALSEAARRARFSARSRRYAQNSFGARQGEFFVRIAQFIAFWLIVIIPTVASGIYFGFMASDQFSTEIKFTVSGTEPPISDGIGVITGIPALSIVQDTQIVANHLLSRAAVEALDAKYAIRDHYSAPSIDWPARFNRDKPIERFVRYWQRMTSVSIQMPSGILDVQVIAFTPEAARDIASGIIELSENLINEMNAQINRDAVAAAEADFERAGQRLTQARVNLQKARNESGLLDVNKAAEGVGRLISTLRATLLQMEQEYQVQLRSVSENAPQMRALRARITTTTAQIKELEAQLTTRNESNDTLSASTLKFSELELERQISERLFTGAVAALELARINAERKRMYLNTFVTPSLPQEAKYPRRVLWIFLTALGGLLGWGILVGLISVIRNHMA